MKATLTVGISGSGKSTWAEAQRNAAGSCVYVSNRDTLRWQISGKTGWKEYKFNRATEDAVTAMQKDSITLAAKGGRDVIIADTNLNPKTRNSLAQFCQELGYEVIELAFPIMLEEAWKRDQFRGEFAVGRDVLYKQWQAWLDYTGRKRYTGTKDKPDAVIYDVDGTLAHMNGRSAFEWHRVGEDKIDPFVVDMLLNHHKQGYEIVIMSGRDSVCRSETEKWLKMNGIPFDALFMRKENDYRKDNIIKKELFWNHVAYNYNVIAVVDDRPQVIRMWYDIGIPKVISVGNPFIEF